MKSLLTIREIDEDDLGDCVKLLRDTYDDETWQYKWSYTRGKKYLESCFRSYNFVSYILEIAGEVKGAIFCHVRPWWEDDKLIIDEILIDKSVRGEGYDLKLLQMVECYVDEKGLGGIFLNTKPGSFGADFYRDNGFTSPSGLQIMHKKL